ncbi:hypothetical protein PAECIP111893_03966 [Paenibacillus plantiphilus]|uniref:RNA polymerase sigma factor n=1 Tax=Paenibacillus plantiphilus TaxID=2905650 RepID=A0ABM9CIB7_9BACL|nr:RNA polymerase sigma factor [Paenibacillus plantiphilus]CAH1215431.1 hypothetical protein PAECIP111893_03966 [Paenibacillus plantiphilus]
MNDEKDQLLLLISPQFSFLDESLQREVYQHFYKINYNRVLFILQDYGAVQDVIQEAFIKTLAKAPPAQDFNYRKAWIIVTVRNLALTYLRKLKKNRNETSIESVFLEGTPFISEESVEKHVEERMLKELVLKYIQVLKPEYRVIIEMRWKQQLSYQEMAEELQLPQTTIKQKLHRARAALRRKLKEWMNTNE